jgi:hypothetical protein
MRSPLEMALRTLCGPDSVEALKMLKTYGSVLDTLLSSVVVLGALE